MTHGKTHKRPERTELKGKILKQNKSQSIVRGKVQNAKP